MSLVLICSQAPAGESPRTVQTFPQQLDGSNQFGVILDGFQDVFFNCPSTRIDQELEIAFDGSELTIKRLYAPCGGFIGFPLEVPTFIPIPAFLSDDVVFPVPLRIKLEVECHSSNEPCPHGTDLPPGVIGYYDVGDVSAGGSEALVFAPGFWQAGFNPWRFFSFSRQADKFIAAAGYAANDNINADLRWSVAAALTDPFMELDFYEPGLADCFNCFADSPVSLRPIERRARVWVAFAAPNLAYLSDGSGATTILTQAPLAVAPPPFGPLVGRFEILAEDIPAEWIEFRVPEFQIQDLPEFGRSYPVATSTGSEGSLVCRGEVGPLGGGLDRYRWQCELRVGDVSVSLPSGSIAADGLYRLRQLAGTQRRQFELFARRVDRVVSAEASTDP